MAIVVRVKRKVSEEPIEAFAVSSKKVCPPDGLSPTTSSDRKRDQEQWEVFRLASAAHAHQQHNTLTRLRHIISAQDAILKSSKLHQKGFSLRLADLKADNRKLRSDWSANARSQVLENVRALNVKELCGEEGVESAEVEVEGGEWVYDMYLSTTNTMLSADCPSGEMEMELRPYSNEEELVGEEESGGEGGAEGDSDSNDESNWRNDYPEEDWERTGEAREVERAMDGLDISDSEHEDRYHSDDHYLLDDSD